MLFSMLFGYCLQLECAESTCAIQLRFPMVHPVAWYRVVLQEGASAKARRPATRSVAMIDGIEGSLRIQSLHGPPKELKGGKQLVFLYEGDRVETAQNGAAAAGFFHDDHWERIGTGTFRVTKTGFDPPGTRLGTPAYATQPGPKHGWDALKRGTGRGAGLVLRGEVVRSLEPRDSPPQVLPIQGELILTDRPELRWPAADGAIRYRVEMLWAGTRAALWTAESLETKLAYPEQPALKRNRKYVWRVSAVRADDSVNVLAEC